MVVEIFWFDGGLARLWLFIIMIIIICDVDKGGVNSGGLWRRWDCSLGGIVLGFNGLEV